MRAEWVAGLADLGGWRLVFAGEHIKANVYQELLRQHVTLWVQRTYPHGKYVFQWIQDLPVAVGGILDSGRLAAIFSWLNDLNPMDFAIWRVLQAKSQGTPHTNMDALHLSIAAEWTAAATSKLWLRKMRLKLSRRSLANTHQPVLYRTTTSFDQTWRPIDGERESSLVHDSLPPLCVNNWTPRPTVKKLLFCSGLTKKTLPYIRWIQGVSFKLDTSAKSNIYSKLLKDMNKGARWVSLTKKTKNKKSNVV